MEGYKGGNPDWGEGRQLLIWERRSTGGYQCTCTQMVGQPRKKKDDIEVNARETSGPLRLIEDSRGRNRVFTQRQSIPQCSRDVGKRDGVKGRRATGAEREKGHIQGHADTMKGDPGRARRGDGVGDFLRSARYARHGMVDQGSEPARCEEIGAGRGAGGDSWEERPRGQAG